MDQQAATFIARPRQDDRAVWDINFGLHAWPLVLVAHELKLFPLLSEQPRSAGEVAHALNIPQRSAEALLDMSTSLGFLQHQEGTYSLTPTAEDYLLEGSPWYYGYYLDLLVANNKLFSYEGMRHAVLTGTSILSGDQNEDWIAAFVRDQANAAAFARGMHSLSLGAAQAWPLEVDLAGEKILLDVAGGTGVHSLGATTKWPELRAIIFDLPQVCPVADGFIAESDVQDRVSTQAGNMWEDPFPAADVHFYSNIYHDWPAERCRFLTKKSFDALTSGGRIILHEMIYNDEKNGPVSVASMNAIMLSWTDGKQYSGAELSQMLRDSGFVDIEIKPTFGYWNIVTGRKP